MKTQWCVNVTDTECLYCKTRIKPGDQTAKYIIYCQNVHGFVESPAFFSRTLRLDIETCPKLWCFPQNSRVNFDSNKSFGEIFKNVTSIKYILKIVYKTNGNL